WLDEICAQCMRRSVIERPTTEAILECLDSSGKYGLAAKPSYKKTVFALFLLALSVVLGLLWYQSEADRAPILELKETRSSIFTNRDLFEVIGRVVDTDPSHVLVNGKRVELGRGGVFQKSIKLTKGPQLIQLVAVDASGKESGPQKLKVTLDRLPPKIKFDSVLSSRNGELFIKGTVNEAIESAKYLSASCVLDGMRFSIKLNLGDYRRAGALIVRDVAGNEAVVRLPFLVAGQTKSEAFGTFSTAIRKAKPKDTIFLVPGRYKMLNKPPVSVRIVGVGRRENIVLYAKDRPFLDVTKVSVGFKNLTVRHESREGGGIVASSGRIEFEDCLVELEGRKSFLVDGQESAVIFSASNCQFRLSGREGSRFSKARVFFSNVDVKDSRQLLVQGDNLELISLFNCDRYYWFRVNLHRSRSGGVLIVSSRGEMENCEIHHCNKRGLVLNAGSLKLRGSLIYANRYAGLALGHGAKAEALACRFQGNASSVDQRFAGIYVYDRSELTLIACEVSDHSQYGIVAMDDGRVKLNACKLKNNKPSDFYGDYQGLLERRD
ncbi:MAG: right-handed parallel beta-helix repeat-containing protein, partial [Planctomycetota bacterium]|nr:right-handed parallel beta-helix repeat-containing protein [Planctomycetota bacterium]